MNHNHEKMDFFAVDVLEYMYSCTRSYVAVVESSRRRFKSCIPLSARLIGYNRFEAGRNRHGPFFWSVEGGCLQ